MPGLSGPELVRRARAARPDLPVVMVTAYASLEGAVDALRAGADEFVQKPLDPEEVLGTLRRLLATRPKRRVLAIGAHPDDVEIGVGGTLLSHVASGDDVAILALSRGANGGDPERRVAEATEAARRLSASLMLGDLDDGSIPEAGLTVALIEHAVSLVRPDTIYTHCAADRHQDHRAVHQATAIGARTVGEVLAYQAPSTTVDFRPTRFVDIGRHLAGKLHAIGAHASQTEKCAYLAHELVRATARYWSRFCTASYVEPLEVAREASSVEPPRDLTNAEVSDVAA